MDQATITRTPETHDYTLRAWGHNVEVLRIEDEGIHLAVMGFGMGVREGDYLLVPNHATSTRYQVDSIKYMRDPQDQWFADVTFSPRDEVAR